jgi:Protein of unknown function (DUF3054)
MARSRPALLLLDLAAVVAFAALGRASHGEDLAGTLITAAPFAAGAGVGTLVARSWRDPLAWHAGLVVWAGAAVVGLFLRAAVTGRLPLSFAIIATISLGVLLLGWRGAVRLVGARGKSGVRPGR